MSILVMNRCDGLERGGTKGNRMVEHCWDFLGGNWGLGFDDGKFGIAIEDYASNIRTEKQTSSMRLVNAVS